MTKLVGIDPGRTIGYCYVEYLTSTQEFDILDAGETHDISGARFLAGLPADFYVIESFVLFKNKLQEVAVNDPDLLTVQVIGALRVLIGDSKIVMQRPLIKQAVPDKMLKELNLWYSSLHTRDALRHVIYYVYKEIK